MPRSLRSLDMATGALEYVMTEEEFQQLKSADDDTKKILFEKFWKQKDQTPGTAFNEAMEEYYRRVDYALQHFETLRQENGMKSDRGKAYILYGSPTKTERNLSPGSSPTEVWYYSKLKKKLTFIDEHRSGDYRLTSVDRI